MGCWVAFHRLEQVLVCEPRRALDTASVYNDLRTLCREVHRAGDAEDAGCICGAPQADGNELCKALYGLKPPSDMFEELWRQQATTLFSRVLSALVQRDR